MMASQRRNQSLIQITALVILFTLLNNAQTRPSSSSTTTSNISTFTKALGNKQFRICKARTFSFFLHAVCLHHRPLRKVYKRVAIRPHNNNILERKEAKSFIKSRRQRRSTDQNYMDECCGSSKHGCNVNEIFEYCNYVPLPQVVLMRRKKFS